jgi:hypothetical protein
MAYHARKAPSSAHRWGGRDACTASIQTQDLFTGGNTGSDAARMGTTGHKMCAEMLLDPSIDPQSYRGRALVFWLHPESDSSGEDWAEIFDIELIDPCVEFNGKHTVDQELIDLCMMHVDYVRERLVLTGGTLYVEQSVPIDHITGEQGATGSCDVAIVYGNTIEIIDLKLGRMPVGAFDVVTPAHTDIITGAVVPEVVEPNEQLAMYASGMIRMLAQQFDNVIITISQPPLKSIRQWSGGLYRMNLVIERLYHRSRECDTDPVFRPSASNCHFCRASGSCAAQTEMVVSTALEGFDDLTTAAPATVDERKLGDLFAILPLVNDWSAAVMDRVRQSLTDGKPVVRSDGLSYKLVAGKNGARKWVDEVKAEITLHEITGGNRSLIYEQSLISPTTAEKLATPKKVKKGQPPLPPAIDKTNWAKLQELMIQGEGQPTIVLETDPRPSLSTTAGFSEVPTIPNQDLFY